VAAHDPVLMWVGVAEDRGLVVVAVGRDQVVRFMFCNPLVRMFTQALETVMTLPETRRDSFLDRLQDVRASSQGIGWGVEDAFNDLWQRAGLEFDR
jgi:hypothetical protein